MLKFDEKKQLDSVSGALALRGKIESIVDTLCSRGYDGIYFMGIGGTYASSLQVVCHIKGQSSIPVYVENAAEYLTTGNRRISKNSIVIISSVTGSTSEMIEALEVVKATSATVLGFIDVPNSPLSTMVDYEVVYPGNEQLKFFMTADRFMFNNGEFDDYQKYYAEMEKYLPQALIDVEKSADDFGKQLAKKHKDDTMHYFVGAGNQYGATYSYAMCYWEEQHWIKTKSIHSAEFFHGMLEIIERDTAVTVFVGEDKERSLSERVAKFLPRICSNFNIIDTKDYELKGISPEFRGSISHLVMHAVTQRIDAHLENINCHPMEIRRYYRCLDY
ncbi:MAG: glucosamine-fructose-6-phosphate aminotransferase [Firmicutes bacterium HGW-Firmicutes-7]|nr:MAG: glucosamine-fructose-6-phosphate aminotransferase [Firmicutes bacterium HGW-Firmicutes-7]